MYEVEFQEDQLKSFHLITSKDETLCRKKRQIQPRESRLKISSLLVEKKELFVFHR